MELFPVYHPSRLELPEFAEMAPAYNKRCMSALHPMERDRALTFCVAMRLNNYRLNKSTLSMAARAAGAEWRRFATSFSFNVSHCLGA